MLRTLRRFLPFAPKPAPIVAAIRLEGVIGGRGGVRGGGLKLAALESALERAFKTPDVAAVALIINSPGGSPVQSYLIHDRIRQLAESHKRRVFAFCEDLAASGGYILACAGDEIFAHSSSLVGSIGVVGSGFGFVDALARIGVERRVYTAGKNKVRLDPFLPEREEDLDFVRRLQTSLHQDFIDLVTTRRAGKLDRATELFEGEVWTGREALALGLIDGLGTPRGVLAEKYGPDVRLIGHARARGSLASRLVGGGADAALDALEARALWARYGL